MARQGQDLEMIALRVHRRDLHRATLFFPQTPKSEVFREIIKLYFDKLERQAKVPTDELPLLED